MKNVVRVVFTFLLLAAASRVRLAAQQSKPIEVKECAIRAVKTARLATDRPGVLAAVQPKEGDAVRENEVLARLMDEVPQASLDVAKMVADDKVEVQFATKAHEVDKAEYEMDLQANRQHLKTVANLEVQRAKLQMEKSELQIEKAVHEVKVNDLKAMQAEAELKTYRILAPFDGIVTRVSKYRGEAVHQGDTILEVVNTDVVRIEGRVTEREIWSVKVGSPVTVQLDLKGRAPDVERQVFRGRIGFVDVVANSASLETRVWAEVPNPNNVLRPGLLATMTIEPSASVTQTGEKSSIISSSPSLSSRHAEP
jgi:RND family efflux transporter MFP subunit